MFKFITASAYVVVFHVAICYFLWYLNELTFGEKLLGTLIITGFCSLSAIRQIHEDDERRKSSKNS